MYFCYLTLYSRASRKKSIFYPLIGIRYYLKRFLLLSGIILNVVLSQFLKVGGALLSRCFENYNIRYR